MAETTEQPDADDLLADKWLAEDMLRVQAELDFVLGGPLGPYAAVLFRSGAAACHELAGDETFHELIDRLLRVFKRCF